MARVEIKLSGLSAATRSVDAVATEEGLARVLGALAAETHREALNGADSHTKTGALFRAVRNVPIAGGRAVIIDESIAPHGLFVHFGTRPHIIKPSKKKALRWAGGGVFHFAQKVRHPGYAGDPFLFDAADKALSRFDSIVRRALGA